MPTALIRPDVLYAWKGSSLLIVNPRGECSDAELLCGYYHREARFVRTLRLEINGAAPWLCEASAVSPEMLAFTFVHPERTSFGGGGTGQADETVTVDESGLPHRALAIHLVYETGLSGLTASVTVTNYARQLVECTVAWRVDADFADIQEAQSGNREQTAAVDVEDVDRRLIFTYRHPSVPYRTAVEFQGGTSAWKYESGRLSTRLRLEPGGSADYALTVHPIEPGEDSAAAVPADVRGREAELARWRRSLARVSVPGNRVAEHIIASNVRDFTSFPILDGRSDEWLALQAGMPLYPALFGRDSLTAGWQAASLDRGQSLQATLTLLGRLQSDRVDDWRDEEPGRIPYQIRRGPLARLNLNPYSGYYADYASPLMYVIALAHLYAWAGEKALVEQHWDTARRILEWAATYGDKDRDGYLEYLTRSSRGTKNQGWKDSGDAIIYEDGTSVPAPLATCEIQGYWFAAQQAMAVLSGVMGAYTDAKAYWKSATELKVRFNRDWWIEDEGFIALARDADGRLARSASSNVGHCIAAGIVSSDHLPPVVGRLFAPDMFSGWGIRTLSAAHVAYDPLSYHRGTVWAVEQATTVFGLRRFGFDVRAMELAEAMFDLAQLYPEYRIPECVGGYARADRPTPGAYPRANTPQLWNATAFPLLVHTLLGLQPVAPLQTLFVDPALPAWLPEVVIHDLRLGGAAATLRCWRDRSGASHAEVLRKRGTFRLVRQPPPESLTASAADRFAALAETLIH